MVTVAYRGLPRHPPAGQRQGYKAPGLGRAVRVPFAGLAGLPVPAWQVHPGELRKLARASAPIAGLGGFAPYRSSGFAGFGRLGLSPTESTVAKAAPAVGAQVGSAILPGVGTAVGAAAGEVISLVAGLFAKQYFDVASMNADEDKEVAAWQKYVSIQGHVAGRAYGLDTMASIWNGAVHSGMFPLNNAPNSGGLCFHDGCGKYPGDARWVTATIQGCSQGDCFPNALPLYNQQRSGKPSDTPDAIYFMDDIFLPLFESKAQIKWISAADGNPQVQQLLYDVADAYLAQNASGTTPYVEFPAAQAGTPTPGAVNAQGSTGAKTAAPASSPAPAAASGATVAWLNASGAMVTGTPAQYLTATGNGAPTSAPAAGTVWVDTTSGWEQITLAAAPGVLKQAAAATVKPAAAATVTPIISSTSLAPASSSTSSSATAPASSTAAPASASSTVATVPYTSTATSLPSVEPTGTTGSTAPSTAYQPVSAAPAISSGLSTTDWLLILIGAGLVLAATRGR